MDQITFPDELLIGLHRYGVTVSRDDMQDGHIGECDFREEEIRIDPRLKPMRLVDTYLHEIFHALWDAAGLQEGCDEETAVSSLSTWMIALMRDNPSVFDPIWEAIGRTRRVDLAGKLQARGTFG